MDTPRTRLTKDEATKTMNSQKLLFYLFDPTIKPQFRQRDSHGIISHHTTILHYEHMSTQQATTTNNSNSNAFLERHHVASLLVLSLGDLAHFPPRDHELTGASFVQRAGLLIARKRECSMSSTPRSSSFSFYWCSLCGLSSSYFPAHTATPSFYTTRHACLCPFFCFSKECKENGEEEERERKRGGDEDTQSPVDV
jgi:hypothetical protein